MSNINNDITSMLVDIVNNNLSNGYKLLEDKVTINGFMSSLINKAIDLTEDDRIRKFAASASKIFIKRKYDDININERQIIFDTLLKAITMFSNNDMKNYFIINYISKMIAIMISILLHEDKEKCSQGISTVLSLISSNAYENIIRVLNYIVSECDDRLIIYANDILSKMVDIFDKVNPKNQEKILIIIEMMLNKISYLDGTDDERENEILTKGNLFNRIISIVINVINIDNKYVMLCDLKKHAIKIVDIFISELSTYSSSHNLSSLITPHIISIYISGVLPFIGSKLNSIVYSEEDKEIILQNQFDYTKGYESDNEEDIGGIDGMLIEVMQTIIDIEDIDKDIITKLMLTTKLYGIDNEDIDDDEDDEMLTLKKQSTTLIEFLSELIDDEVNLAFVNVIFNELTKGVDLSIYANSGIGFTKEMLSPSMNTYLYQSDLFIIGVLSKKLYTLLLNKTITIGDIDKLLQSLLTLINNKDTPHSIIYKSIWCLCKLNDLYRHHIEAFNNILSSILSSITSNKNTTIKYLGYSCLYDIDITISLDENIVRNYIDAIFSIEITGDNVKYIMKGIIAGIKSNQSVKKYTIEKYISKIIDDILFKCSTYSISDLFALYQHLISVVVDSNSNSFSDTVLNAFSFTLLSLMKSMNIINSIPESSVQIQFTKDIKLNDDTITQMLSLIAIILEKGYYTKSIDNQLSMLVNIIDTFIKVIISKGITDVSFIQTISLLILNFIRKTRTISNLDNIKIYINYILNGDNLMESAQLYIHEIIFILLLSNDIEINVDLINRLKTQMTKSQLNTTIYSILLILMREFIENSKDMLSIMNKEEVKIFIKNILIYDTFFISNYTKELYIKTLISLIDINNETINTTILGRSVIIIIFNKLINYISNKDNEEYNDSYHSEKYSYLNMRNDEGVASLFYDEEEDHHYEEIDKVELIDTDKIIVQWIKHKISVNKEFIVEVGNYLSEEGKSLLNKISNNK